MSLQKDEAERAQDLLRRLADLNDQLLLSAQERLLRIGPGTSPSEDAEGGSELWPTYAALEREHQQQQRAIQSAQWALGRLMRKAGLSHGARPAETWGDPARELHAALARDGWHKGEPRDPSIAAADRAACAALHCPHCERASLRYVPYVRNIRRRGEYRAFGLCDLCGLIQELPTAWWQRLVGDTESEPRDRGYILRSTPRATRSDIYFDREARAWNRRRGEKVPPLLVAGKEDTSPEQRQQHRECWACRNSRAHSREFHDLQMLKAWRRHTASHQDDDGWIHLTALEDPLPPETWTEE